MIRLGITGGIGSGKSHVSQMLRDIGIPVYEADAQSKRLTNNSPLVREQLTRLVSPEVYTPEGNLRRDILARYVFGSPEGRQQVNDIIHPMVRADFRSWATQQNRPIVAIESAILFEAGFRNEVDCVLMVNAPEALRIERTMKRDNTTREAVMARIQAQMDDKEKIRLSDYVIDNDGRDLTAPLRLIIDKIHENNR